MGNWARLFGKIDLFKGRNDKLWRAASTRRGPKVIPGLLSRILDVVLRPKS